MAKKMLDGDDLCGPCVNGTTEATLARGRDPLGNEAGLFAKLLGAAACLAGMTSCLLALSALPYQRDHALAARLRESYGYGGNIVAAEQESPTNSSSAELSDHDLFMLVEGARFQIAHDEALSAASADGTPPILYRYLDEYNTDRYVFKLALQDALPAAERMVFTERPDVIGALTGSAYKNWLLSPVLLDASHRPPLRELVAQALADDPLLSVHTCGQITADEVRVHDVRFALDGVLEAPGQRAAEIAQLKQRVEAIAQQAEALSSDAHGYAAAAFDLIAGQVSYAYDRSVSPHYNDAYGALVEGSSRCYGLAGALKLVLDARGIPNYLADGSKEDGRHTWNVLYLNGAWRVCDLTLMLGAFGDEPWRTSGEVAEVGYGRLVLEHNYQTDHHVKPDAACRRLEAVYNELVKGEPAP